MLIEYRGIEGNVVDVILLLLALVCFVIAAFGGWGRLKQINAIAVGLALYVLSLLI